MERLSKWLYSPEFRAEAAKLVEQTGCLNHSAYGRQLTDRIGESRSRLFGQIFHGDKWSPVGIALSTVTVAEGPYRP